MNLLAPSSKILSLFSALPFVTTLSPFALAIGIAIAPTLPVPPEIKIVFPSSAFISSNACIIVSAVKGTAAASISER